MDKKIKQIIIDAIYDAIDSGIISDMDGKEIFMDEGIVYVDGKKIADIKNKIKFYNDWVI